MRKTLVKRNNWQETLRHQPITHKKTLKMYKSLCKITNAMIVKMKTEKISLQKFLHFRKVLKCNLPKYLCRQEI